MAPYMCVHMFSLLLLLILLNCECLQHLSPSDIFLKVQNSCVFAATSAADDKIAEILDDLAVIFEDDERVIIGALSDDLASFNWIEGNVDQPLKWSIPTERQEIAFFLREKRDRTCLIRAPSMFPKAEPYDGPISLDMMLEFVNTKCGTYRNHKGGISIAGIHREYILSNLFRVSDISNCTSRMVFKEKSQGCEKQIGSVCNKHDEDENDDAPPASRYLGEGTRIPECERVTMPTKDGFFHDFLKRSKPVIITDAMRNWKAIRKWTNEFLRQEYGHKEIHIKLAPYGEFEGCEPSRIWEDSRAFKIPQKVRDQLPFPDLVVVRPATMNLKFSDFLDMVENATLKKNNISAYLEYSSIPEYMPDLEQDIEDFPFVKEMLIRKHLNIWISDGNTLGKLHFDPFDNFLCMISGKKQLIIFEPHENDKLYEAHIPEAILDYHPGTGKFRRKRLLDSTSMVMSPVDILNPDFTRFPEFSKTYPMNCTISEGEVLFMPAFWWHEVQSFPSPTENRNVAINFWYDPFLTKDFPCPECTLDVNPNYSYLL